MCKRITIEFALSLLLVLFTRCKELTNDTNVNITNKNIVFADTINIHKSNNDKHCFECDSIFKFYFTSIARNWINTDFQNIDSINFIHFEERIDEYCNNLYYSDTMKGFFSPFNIVYYKVFNNNLKYFVLNGIGICGTDENRIIFVYNTGGFTKTISVQFDFLIDNINAFEVAEYTHAFIIRYFEKFGNTETTVNERFIVLNKGGIFLDTTFYIKTLKTVTVER